MIFISYSANDLIFSQTKSKKNILLGNYVHHSYRMVKAKARKLPFVLKYQKTPFMQCFQPRDEIPTANVPHDIMWSKYSLSVQLM